MVSGRTLAVSLVSAVALVMTGVIAPAGHANPCPSASVGGPAVGTITVGDVVVPITPVSYPPGGTLRPPDTALAAGVSTVNAPLDATIGTTVMAWHVRFGRGCRGALNPLLGQPVGATFAVQARGSESREYRITQRREVPRGSYPRAWFNPLGPHRLALFTCGDLRYEKFHSTIAIFAEPVIDPGSSEGVEEG